MDRAERTLTEYVSEIEKIKKARELAFPADQAFGKYEGLFAKGSVAHPAKMSTRLAEYLVTHYTKEGETIVDPFGGVGTTGVVGALNNRNVVLNELEPRFVNFIKQTKKNVECQTLDFSPHGSITVHQGDSRKLSEILSAPLDSCVTSPPYARVQGGEKGIITNGYESTDPKNKGCALGSSSPRTYSVDPANIDNLPYVDAAISSPPYAETLKGSGADAARKRIAEGRYHGLRPDVWLSKGNIAGSTFGDGYSKDESNIGNLKYVDAVVTSPPYEGTGLSGGDEDARNARLEKNGFDPKDYTGGNARNTVLKPYDASITSLPYSDSEAFHPKDSSSIPPHSTGPACMDSVITSPPFEAGLAFNSANAPKYAKGGIPKAYEYGQKENQIGNLKTGSYLEAVFQVYRETFSVLKENGIACIVVKPFQRNGAIVDLPLQTWKLLEKCGFVLEDVLKMRLNSLSFWRILHYRKNKQIAQLWHEYVIVCKKPRASEESLAQ